MAGGLDRASGFGGFGTLSLQVAVQFVQALVDERLGDALDEARAHARQRAGQDTLRLVGQQGLSTSAASAVSQREFSRAGDRARWPGDVALKAAALRFLALQHPHRGLVRAVDR